MAVIFFLHFFRTKIQAQRKFAQGQQPPSSAYLTYNLTSGSETPVKEKSQERELLPNLRPNTEDFLTFLCFRGTNALPKELDFQNTLNQPSTSGSSAKVAKNSPEKKGKDANAELKKKTSTKKTETVTSAKQSEPVKSNAAPEKDPKTGFMPFAVRKRAEMHPAKNDKKKLQMVAKKKQQNKDDSNSNEAESSNGPRTTRANPVEETSNETRNNSTKKANKRKTIEVDTSTESKSLPEKKADVTPAEKVPSDSQKKGAAKAGSSKKEEEKRQTRLSAIRNPSSSSTPNFRNGNDSAGLDKYFSSSESDDEPLVKPEPKNKKAKLNDESTKTTVSKNNSEVKNETIKSANDSQQPVKSNRGRKKKVVPAPEPEQKSSVEPEKPPEKKKVGRKKKMNVDLEIANSQANTTDLSENETRGRPMRKTKEAATIYMELIGRKLTLLDSSDNDSSLDSLEVPNLKRVELLENEFQANCEKAKEAVAEKKKQEEKEVRKNFNLIDIAIKRFFHYFFRFRPMRRKKQKI